LNYQKNFHESSGVLAVDCKVINICGEKYCIFLAFDTNIGLVNCFFRIGNEDSFGYKKFLKQLINEKYIIKAIVSDGGTGIFSTVRALNIRIHQRCHIHLLRDLKTGLKISPKRMKLNIRKYYIYKYAKLLLDSKTEEQKELRLKHFYRVVNIMYQTNNPVEANTTKLFIRNLKAAFMFMEYDYLDIPRTTNIVEGYISRLNARLKTTRGLKNPANAELIINGINYFLNEEYARIRKCKSHKKVNS
jgi:transposase-like protein